MNSGFRVQSLGIVKNSGFRVESLSIVMNSGFRGGFRHCREFWV